MEKQLTKLEILEETVAFYSEDTSRRAYTKNVGCEYNTSDGRHCAVGRCFNENIQALGDDYSGNQVGIDAILDFDSLLQDKYKGHNIEFWSYLQLLHDIDDNWDKKGLTKIGLDEVENLKEIFSKLD